ncbi:Alg9-like mannosyltransferase family-domain-containing protein [Astrocystis sublimbata]|nr:Alg9-like mannosyltransferase family-domain-containing protein [Astrocystis sublimbata]
MGNAIDTLLSLSIPALVLFHLAAAPYTKVEESFNIQATHDILAYGTPTSNVYERLSSHYDHFDFPGAVPRTFIGPVLLAGISQPLVAAVGFQHAQLIVRALLGLINSAALLIFKRNLERAFGRSTARWYAVLQASQFHILFYASRPLPNMFAFPLTTLAFSQLVPHPDPRRQGVRFKVAIALLTMATAIFRSELAILMVTVSLYGLLHSHVTLTQIIKPFILFFALSLLISVPIDSYFWQKPLWPELWGFYYNAVQGSSSDWGVSPWHWYFTSALPKILGVPALLLLFAGSNPETSTQTRDMMLPSLLFVAIYSLQPHKEMRFVFYVAPPLTAALALRINYVFSRRTKSTLLTNASLAIVGTVLVSFAMSSALLVVSSLNYPGGEALAALKDIVVASDPSAATPDIQTAVVHMDVLSCMTGITLFGQHDSWPDTVKTFTSTDTETNSQTHANPNADTNALQRDGVSFTFDKTEDEATLRNPLFWEKFDFVLAEDPAKPLGPWETVAVVEGFAGIEILKPGSEGVSGGGGDDIESGKDRVLGRGALVKRVRDTVRRFTGGWWVGPRMAPRIHILRKIRDGEARRAVTS